MWAEAMRHAAWFLGVTVAAATATGCVERRYVIYTDPPGAIVLRNGQPLGASPVDDYFTYYGNYHFTIIKDGYETLQVDQCIRAPWYEVWPLDFVSENLIPWSILDRREFHYKLERKQMPNTDELLREAQNLRNRGISLGGGSAAAPVPVPAPPPGTLPPPPVTPAPPPGS
jgi:hypothetical protein